MGRIAGWIKGSVTCGIKGEDSHRFMNLCRNRGIYLRNVYVSGEVGSEGKTEKSPSLNGQPEPEMTVFDISLNDFWKLRPVVKKSHCVPRVLRRKGLPFVLQRSKRHPFFYSGILLLLVLLYILSSRIWDIEIQGNLKYSDQRLVEFMSEVGIHTGMAKSMVDSKWLEDELRLKYNDISWVSAKITGTKLVVQIKEADLKADEEKSAAPGDIVADSDGMIESIVVRRGTAAVAPGDWVRAGDVLIYGKVDIFNDDGSVGATHPVRADGDVTARIKVFCQDYYPAYTIHKNYTGNKRSRWEWTLFGKTVSLGTLDFREKQNGFLEHGEDTDQGYEMVSEMVKYRLTPNFYLPLTLNHTVVRAYEPQKVWYSRQEQERLARQVLEDKLTAFKKEGAQIIENQIQCVFTEKNYGIYGSVEMIGPMGTFRENSQLY